MLYKSFTQFISTAIYVCQRPLLDWNQLHIHFQMGDNLQYFILYVHYKLLILLLSALAASVRFPRLQLCLICLFICIQLFQPLSCHCLGFVMFLFIFLDPCIKSSSAYLQLLTHILLSNVTFFPLLI